MHRPHPAPEPDRLWSRARLRLLRNLVLVVVLYFVVPLGGERSDPVLWVRATLVLVVFVLVGRSVVRRVSQELQDDPVVRGTEGLLVAIVVGVVCSALADYLVATLRPGEFEGIDTRLDALYFVLATLTTVGYGDVHPVGQLARGVVAVQLVFNVMVIATAAGLVSRVIKDRVERRRFE